jgi:hypothetical protein
MTSKDETGLRVDRRTTIKWLASTMAAAYAGCSSDEKYLGDEIPTASSATSGRLGTAANAGGAGYGTDPDLISPVVPWPRTMTEAQLRIAALLCDMILPEDDRSPAASAVGVPDFIDEWVSAPYAKQKDDREIILPGLEWLERQSLERFGSGFVEAGESQKAELLDAIAWRDQAAPGLEGQLEFFERFRYLSVGAFYTTEAGSKDIGYIGNTPIAGDYPGPSDAAMAHLAGVLKQLGLPAVDT